MKLFLKILSYLLTISAIALVLYHLAYWLSNPELTYMQVFLKVWIAYPALILGAALNVFSETI